MIRKEVFLTVQIRWKGTNVNSKIQMLKCDLIRVIFDEELLRSITAFYVAFLPGVMIQEISNENKNPHGRKLILPSSIT